MANRTTRLGGKATEGSFAVIAARAFEVEDERAGSAKQAVRDRVSQMGAAAVLADPEPRELPTV